MLTFFTIRGDGTQIYQSGWWWTNACEQVDCTITLELYIHHRIASKTCHGSNLGSYYPWNFDFCPMDLLVLWLWCHEPVHHYYHQRWNFLIVG